MSAYLSENKIKYVLYHFSLVAHLEEVEDDFVFLKSAADIAGYSRKIIFLLSENELPETENPVCHKNIPILFPNGSDTIVSVENNNLIFHFDLFRSVFYLLSGQQEVIINKRDKFNRFPYSESIQKKLNIAHKPVVNYYFDFIIEEINRFYNCGIVVKKKMFDTYGLLLTHDIDNIKYYTFNKFLYKIKELIGLRRTTLSRKDIVQFMIQYVTLSRNNPYWCFDKLINIEAKFGYKASFYFLKKEEKNVDSTYSFSDGLVQKAFQYIKEHGAEIGLHGTVNSAYNMENLQSQKVDMEKHAGITIFGGRQHRLIYSTPYTAIIQSKVGLQYDSTLGFAEQEGFRNSYCLPFHLYDFEKDQMLAIWEFPLIVMDTTLFYYQKYSIEEAIKAVLNLISEIKRFSGLFTMLWHNGFEVDYPSGYLDHFYENLLAEIKKTTANNYLAKDLLKIIAK